MASTAGYQAVETVDEASSSQTSPLGRVARGAKALALEASEKARAACAKAKLKSREAWSSTASAMRGLVERAASHSGTMLVASHGCTTIFSTAWEFSLPLALLDTWGGSSLAAPAALTLAVTLTTALFAPTVGRWSDDAERLPSIRVARAAQVAGTSLSLAGVWLVRRRRSWLVLVLLGASVEAAGATVSKGAAKKEWAPQMFQGEALSRVTFRLSTISQIAEIAGPFIGAVLLAYAGDYGAILVGALAIFFELPAQLIMDALYLNIPALRRAKKKGPTDFAKKTKKKISPLDQDDQDQDQDDDEEPCAVVFVSKSEEEEKQDRGPQRSAWRAWLCQPSGTAMLTVSFSFLFFTALAPHGAVLTAYLATQKVHPTLISAFRACGAFAGVAGIAGFSALARYFSAEEAATGGEEQAPFQESSSSLSSSPSKKNGGASSSRRKKLLSL
eukprot:CAMPEP_0118908544 /NCGR_PEP_ID=MMETSP1166-20130328/11512_1 /TAXON_ID=1104430 /ORGANISM="Chrysoreinhardia sp, Strain CCMP3193" /LENGTH=445 /DNA_ID=CAMNT_0006847939 /DNA_START=1 /DNA_END=1335 /DNA_ORIENTATION=-